VQSVDCFDECNLISNLIRYHHVLKSHWLDGKRNQRIDHLIHMLVEGMIPYYETRHLREVVGLEGPDLAKQCYDLPHGPPFSSFSSTQTALTVPT
jgi:hypothetical protein